MLLAHRLSYRYAYGEFDEKLYVLHRCDNPPCINPEHLFLGDAAANMADKVAKGRQPRGIGMPGTKLTDDMVIEIRSRYAKGETTHQELAAEFGVSPSGIGFVIKRGTWKHIP